MITVLLLDDFDHACLTRWSLWFCRAWKHDLCLIRIARRQKTTRHEVDNVDDLPEEIHLELPDLSEDFTFGHGVHDSETQHSLKYISIESSNIVRKITDELKSLKPDIVVVPRNNDTKSTSPDFAVQRQLLSELSSAVLLFCPNSSTCDGSAIRHIVVPSGEGSHSYDAIVHAKQLAETANAKISAVYVEPDLGEDARPIGKRILNRTLSRSIGESQHSVETHVAVNNNVIDGIRTIITDEVDLVVMGMQHHGVVHRFFFRSLSEEMTLAKLGPAVAILRAELPLTGRFLRACEQTVRTTVPQIERESRLTLVERIQSSSKWNFDFIALICLSTLIAGGGLIQNSAAVVIGAMLVAPLMTPLLGTGLALIQANRVLFRNTILTVGRGFLLAFILGCILGLIVPGLELTDEMYARGSPAVFDLVVAFISGIAAAYATSRPNLLSALPGVAIAASLVPPIATSGIATSNGDFGLALGAAILFFSNILAIVLGTSVSFWAVGIRGSHEHGHFEQWSLFAGSILLMLAISLGIYDSVTARQLPQALNEAVSQTLHESGGRCDTIHWDRRQRRKVIVRVLAPQQISTATLTRVVDVVRSSTTARTQVEIRTTLTWAQD